MQMTKAYKTIAERATAEFVERRSRFIGSIMPVQTEAEAIAFINELKSTYWDANHNAYAYRIREGQLKRYSDDGEPQGTAGVPALDVLEREDLVDVCVVVTRYFGGILLGGGGLIRAYGHGAKIAVDAAVIKHMRPCTRFSLECGYEWYGKLEHLLPRFETVVESTDFGAVVRMQLYLPTEQVGGFQKALTDLTSAMVVPVQMGTLFADIPVQ